jgi:ADP-ribose pyrophosphatase YjhB (NUDIX family)
MMNRSTRAAQRWLRSVCPMPTPDFVLELRRSVGQAELWMPGVTAVVRRGDEVLLVLRADNGEWAPVGGIVEPGEEPAVCAAREVLEETGVVARVDRLASTSVMRDVVHVNGDRAAYLDQCFACTWVSGEARVADDESREVRWWPVDDLPPMRPVLRERIEAALSDEQAARFVH